MPGALSQPLGRPQYTVPTTTTDPVIAYYASDSANELIDAVFWGVFLFFTYLLLFKARRLRHGIQIFFGVALAVVLRATVRSCLTTLDYHATAKSFVSTKCRGDMEITPETMKHAKDCLEAMDVVNSGHPPLQVRFFWEEVHSLTPWWLDALTAKVFIALSLVCLMWFSSAVVVEVQRRRMVETLIFSRHHKVEVAPHITDDDGDDDGDGGGGDANK